MYGRRTAQARAPWRASVDCVRMPYMVQANNQETQLMDDTITITITIKTIELYGEPRVYPVNNEARALAAIAKTKSLSLGTLSLARQMGCRIEGDLPAGWRDVL
jgi:hypothetical protein